MQHELRVREAKLRAEQQERVERERQRLEKNRILQERQKMREKEREEEKSRKIQAQMEEERKAQERMEQLTEQNRGVYYSSLLQAVPRDEAAVTARGIRRASDKVSLPPSVGALLMQLDAPRNGAPCFEISTPGGSVTHTGVLDFTAPEGVVALPRKVADCLWGRGAAFNGPVTVTYKRLDKGSFVRFQPLTRGFHEAVSEQMREVLERALMQCTFLTQGDIIRVDCSPVQSPAAGDSPGPDAMEQDGPEGESGGAAASTSVPLMFDLLVQELQPAAAVSLIDTDMEAQVVPSLETEQALQKLEEQRQQLEEQRQERERLALEALRLAQDEEQRRRQQQLEEAQRREQRRAGLEASLPPEPPAPQEGMGAGQGVKQATGVFRFPDGSRVTRRFLLDSPTALLFHFCDAKGAGGLAPGSYRLVLQYPRRVVLPGHEGTLAQAGVAAGQQEVMMLEPMSAGAEHEGAGGRRGAVATTPEATGTGQA